MLKMLFKSIAVASLLALTACSHGNCYSQQKAQSKKESGGAAVSEAKVTERIKVAKADGSLQCNQGKKISAADMQKELGAIKVYSSQNLNDGLMRIQKCGTATGMHNVFEIDKNDLETALAAGFKEWLVD